MKEALTLSEMYHFCEKHRQSGDIITLAKVLNISPYAARTRYVRGVKETVKVMYQIIIERDKIINNISQKVSDKQYC